MAKTQGKAAAASKPRPWAEPAEPGKRGFGALLCCSGPGLRHLHELGSGHHDTSEAQNPWRKGACCSVQIRAASRIATEEAAAEDPIARDEAGVLARQLHLTSARCAELFWSSLDSSTVFSFCIQPARSKPGTMGHPTKRSADSYKPHRMQTSA